MSQEKHKSLDDIVFENRNKEYGAYDLRMSERSILFKAFLLGIAFIGLITLGIFSYNAVFAKADKEITEVDITLIDVDEPEIIEEEIEEEEPEQEPEPEPEPEPEVAQVRVVIPEPKEDVVKEEPIVKVEEMEDKVISTKNVEGEKSTSTRAISEPEKPKSEGTGTGPAIVNYSPRQVKDMAVYPGCERYEGKKAELQKCMQQKLSDELGNQMSDFADVMNNRGETTAVAKVRFIIDKSGNIIQVSGIKGGNSRINEDLAKEAELALQRIASRLARRGSIKPAKLEDGSSVNMQFEIPVRYNIQN